MRAREHGIVVGSMPTGQLNKITDVPGVRVGHCTVDTPQHQTGVTVILPCEDNMFLHKLPCASFVWNGFGKTQGLVQVDELGTLETPIALTNTLNVGLVHDAMVSYMIKKCSDDGVVLRSVNPVVCECNDGFLNDIQERAVTQTHVQAAFDAACLDFEEGAVGCGRGMTCHGVKGGVGSASRLITMDGKTYTMGVLVQTNHGRLEDLQIGNKLIGPQIAAEAALGGKPDQGSCIIILATDLPLSDRQLRRVIKRCSVGLARVGSYVGHGSGEVFIGFSTANRYHVLETTGLYTGTFFPEEEIDLCFRAAAECTEEAVLNSMLCAQNVTGRDGNTRRAITDFDAFGREFCNKEQ